MDESILSSGVRLAAHVAVPTVAGPTNGLVLCHGLANEPRGAATVGTTFPDLADRLARDAGWHVLTLNLRGTGTSEGDFSVGGWIADLRAAVQALASRSEVRGVWTCGFGHGGTFAVCEAADDPLVRGVATVAGPVSLASWARGPRGLLAHAREMGMVRTPGFPPDPAAWAREVATLDAVAAARRLGGRPLLVLHGADDDEVPTAEARAVAVAAGVNAELRLVPGAGHRLRHDPRAIATLLGWLDRQVVDPN
jgi:fermentation-respiration switch protein FrsA (DUF1100 family)